MRNLLITSLLVLLPSFVFSQDKVSHYISNYQHIAVSEMNRSGIPASITLAQGMFESAYGQSPSAISYNNHFGIKCKKEWTGPYFYKHDDDRDKNGKLIPSCFRAYASVDESYQDHTNFLVERERYAELFSYGQTDYYNWAIGLERCGYATNKMYAERLISIIERYGLNQFDDPQFAVPEFVSTRNPSQDDTADEEVATDAFSHITSSSEVNPSNVAIAETTDNDTFQKEKNTARPTSKVTADVIVESKDEIQDAFAGITSEDIDQILLQNFEAIMIDETAEQPVVSKPSEVISTLEVLESFQEFTNVTPAIPLPAITNTAKPTPTVITPSEAKVSDEPTPISRVNRAIILPNNYRRKASGEQSKMDKR